MPQPIQVLIVDDHAVVRAGIRLCSTREEDIEPVGEAGTGREAVFEARSAEARRDPDGRRDAGPERPRRRCRRSCTSSPETKILVLSMQDDPRYVRAAFAAGASGYVLKEAADAEVVAAVREVAAAAATCIPSSARG